MKKVMTALALAVFVIGMAIRTSAQTPPMSGGKKSPANAATGRKTQLNAAANQPLITKVMTQETVIGNMKVVYRTFVTSTDSRHVAYVVTTHGGNQLVVEDGVAGKEYDAINPTTLALNSDGKHLLYEALQGQRAVIVVDGVEKPGLPAPNNLTVNPDWEQVNEKRAPGVTNFLVISPDWEHVAFVSRKLDEGSIVEVLDMEGVGGGETTDARGHGELYSDSPVFSSDGKIYEWFPRELSRDGKRVAYSLDGTRKAYPAKRAEKWLAVVADTKNKEPDIEGKEYDEIGVTGIIFSADGKQVAYTARRGEKWVTVVNNVEGKVYDGIEADSLAFSPDGKRIAYAARRGDNWRVVNGGVEGKPYSRVTGTLVFSPNGKHLAYRAKRGDKWLAVIDDAEGIEYDNFFKGSNFVFDDANRFHFLAGRGDDVLRIDATIITKKAPSK